MDNFPEGEVEEMVQLYMKRGLQEHAARTVVTTMAASPQFFVDVMMLEELQMSPPPQISPGAAATRSACGILFGGMPMLLAAAGLARSFGDAPADSRRIAALWPTSHSYLLLVALGLLMLGCLGSWRAGITHQQRRRLALQTCGLLVPGMFLARAAGCTLFADGVAVA